MEDCFKSPFSLVTESRGTVSFFRDKDKIVYCRVHLGLFWKKFTFHNILIYENASYYCPS